MADDELVRRAKSLLDRLCDEPRFAGSAEEEKARAICRAELRANGFDCHDVPFEYSQWPAKWGAPLSSALLAATIVIAARTAEKGHPLLAMIVGGSLIAGLFLLDAHAKRRWITHFPALRSRSVNLEARRGTPRIWLVAHLDSKSQTVAMLVRIAGSLALAAVVGLTTAVLVLAIVGVEAAGAAWVPLQIAAVVAAAPGISCFVRNNSRGALDNASGVAAAILAAQSPGIPRDLGVLITSAEEQGLAGARTWCSTAQSDFTFLNCDTVDDVGGWRCMYTSTPPARVTDAALRVAHTLGIRMRVTRLIPGILADSIPFSDAGMEAVTLSRGTLGTLARIHTRRDFSVTLTGKGAAEASVLLSALSKELT